MKLRIQGNSLRLRLTRKEVAELLARGHIQSGIEFAPDCTLVYALQTSRISDCVTCRYDGRTIVVTLPLAVMKHWAESEQVSIEGSPEARVALLIKKDYQCLHKPEQLDPDAYPHPLA